MQTQDTDTHIKWQSYQTSICQMFSKVCLCFFLYFTINNTCFDILHLMLWHSDTHGKWHCIFFPVVVFDSEETCIFLNVQFDQKCKQEYVYFAPCVSQPKGRLHEVEKTEGQRYERERERHTPAFITLPASEPELDWSERFSGTTRDRTHYNKAGKSSGEVRSDCLSERRPSWADFDGLLRYGKIVVKSIHANMRQVP